MILLCVISDHRITSPDVSPVGLTARGGEGSDRNALFRRRAADIPQTAAASFSLNPEPVRVAAKSELRRHGNDVRYRPEVRNEFQPQAFQGRKC
jgi:hypothetical protein